MNVLWGKKKSSLKKKIKELVYRKHKFSAFSIPYSRRPPAD